MITDDDGRIERFFEKPDWGHVFSDTINTGIYVLEPEVFDYDPGGRAVDFSSEVFPAMLEAGRRSTATSTEGYWEDVGTLEAYLSRARGHPRPARSRIDIDGFPLRPGVWVGEGAEIDPSAKILGPALIGENCRDRAGASICAVTRARRERPGRRERRDRALRDPRQLSTSASGVNARGGVSSRRSSELRQGVHLEDGVVLGDSARSGTPRGGDRRGEGLPAQDRRDGATVANARSSGSRAARGAIFGRSAWQGSRTSTSRRRSRCASPLAYATMLAERRDRGHFA